MLRRLTLALMTGATLAAGLATASPASATEYHRYLCGDGGSAVYYHCGQMAGYYSMQGFHISNVFHNPPGCTAPDGCYPGYYFDYWR